MSSELPLPPGARRSRANRSECCRNSLSPQGRGGAVLTVQKAVGLPLPSEGRGGAVLTVQNVVGTPSPSRSEGSAFTPCEFHALQVERGTPSPRAGGEG